MNPQTGADSTWQQPPPISEGLPFSLQMLSTGAGIGVGCGVGIGFLSPINLSAVPVLGQASQGISAGLAGVSSWAGAAGGSAQQAVRGLGVPGLDVGAGCGVLAGYYFGAGLMLKPSVVQQVAQATSQLAGQLSHAISQKLPGRAAADATSSTSGSGSSSGSAVAPSTVQLPAAAMLSQAASPTGDSSSAAGPGVDGTAGMFAGMLPASTQTPATAGSGRQTTQEGAQQQADPVLMRLVLQQQADMGVLKEQNRQLRAAVCRLDPTAAVCKGWDTKRQGKGGSAAASDGVWSD